MIIDHEPADRQLTEMLEVNWFGLYFYNMFS